MSPTLTPSTLGARRRSIARSAVLFGLIGAVGVGALVPPLVAGAEREPQPPRPPEARSVPVPTPVVGWANTDASPAARAFGRGGGPGSREAGSTLAGSIGEVPSMQSFLEAAEATLADAIEAERQRFQAVLLEDYRWGERSLRVAELQQALDVVVDGWYAGATRHAHLAALAWLDLPNAHVPTPPPVPAGGPSEAKWAALRRCESGGNYSVTNRTGKYRGAYQFDRPTWDSVARRHHPHLVGVDPARAAPADQDAMARSLYSMRGAQPWPVCGRHLR